MYSDPYGRPYVPQQVVVPTSGTAVAALLMGIVSVMGGACLIVPPFVAVWLGHRAMRETKPGLRGGHGMAVTGLVLGYVGVVTWVIGAILWGVVLIGAGVQQAP